MAMRLAFEISKSATFRSILASLTSLSCRESAWRDTISFGSLPSSAAGDSAAVVPSSKNASVSYGATLADTSSRSKDCRLGAVLLPAVLVDRLRLFTSATTAAETSLPDWLGGRDPSPDPRDHSSDDLPGVTVGSETVRSSGLIGGAGSGSGTLV